MKGASGFRALVLLGVAAFCAASTPHETMPSVASKLAEVNHPVACPPQWLPVLLAFHSGHDDSPKSPFGGNVEGPAAKSGANERRSLESYTYESYESYESYTYDSPVPPSCLGGDARYFCISTCHNTHLYDKNPEPKQQCKDACPPLCCQSGDARYSCQATCHRTHLNDEDSKQKTETCKDACL
eukprot:scaffold97996_cov68-Phaeocystis_antarctica.AAC.2